MKKNLNPKNQRDEFGCGPVSIYNALLLAKKYIPLKQLYKECKSNAKIGTFQKTWLNVISSHGFKIKKCSIHEINSKDSFFLDINKNRDGKISTHFCYLHEGIVYNLDNDLFPVASPISDWTIYACLNYQPPGSPCEAFKVVKFPTP
jgi:hypothetical protein